VRARDHHGATIVDVEGREYIDFVGGIGCVNGGHTPDAVVAAIREHMSTDHPDVLARVDPQEIKSWIEQA